MSLYKIDGPTYAFYRTFSRKNSTSAPRWLRKLKHELSGYKTNNGIPADRYLDALNILLTNDAKEWAKSYPKAVRLLTTPTLTKDTIDRFKLLFLNRFPSKALEISLVSIDIELSKLA